LGIGFALWKGVKPVPTMYPLESALNFLHCFEIKVTWRKIYSDADFKKGSDNGMQPMAASFAVFMSEKTGGVNER